MSTLAPFISIPQFTAGERAAALTDVQKTAVGLGQPAIAERAAQALAHEHVTREYDARWAARSYRIYVPEVEALDVQIDPVHGSIHDVAVGHMRGLPPGDPLAVEVQAMLDDAYPGGVGALTKLPYVEQAIANQVVVDKLQGVHAPLVDRLGLTSRVQYLAELSTRYSQAVSIGRNLTFDQVKAMRTRGQELLRVLIAVIVATFPDSDDPAQSSQRQALLEPLAIQSRLVRLRLRRRRRNRTGGEGAEGDEGLPGDGELDGEAPDESPDELPGEMPLPLAL